MFKFNHLKTTSDIRQPKFISHLALGYALHALEVGDFFWSSVKLNNELQIDYTKKDYQEPWSLDSLLKDRLK